MLNPVEISHLNHIAGMARGLRIGVETWPKGIDMPAMAEVLREIESLADGLIERHLSGPRTGEASEPEQSAPE